MYSTDTNADWQSPFQPQHELYLIQRAVPLQLAEAARLKSVSGTEGALLLGFEHPLRSPGLAIPYWDGETLLGWRVRIDKPGLDERGKPKNKFLAAPGQVWPYLPPPPVVPAEAWKDLSKTIYIVEGPIKALALCAIGLVAIGLGGVSAGGHDAERYNKR